jgi:hypothetical protein
MYEVEKTYRGSRAGSAGPSLRLIDTIAIVCRDETIEITW